MDRPSIKTLILPFQRQDRPYPDASKPWAFFNAHPLPDASNWKIGLVCQQSFRPLYLDLTDTGFVTSPTLEKGGLAGALVLTDRAKAVNERNIAHALLSVSEGAPILVCGEKNTGIVPLKKWAARLGTVVDTFSKYHAQCFTLIATDMARRTVSALPVDANAGLFAKGKIDRGSAVLAATFDESLAGDCADFCAGTGHLARALTEQSKPNSLTLLEAEFHAVEASKAALDDIAIPMSFHWLDLIREAPPARYDTIVMNPPFHTARAAEPQLGQALIRAAAKALRPGGKLRMVANRTLPYEQTLQSVFGSFHELTVEDGFKVLQARANK
ncbi:class I SAM-dependent methyltransferase [Pseudahrensia aquimaris]|uniref:Class I SAM-dependent methyltransferase n=1 Tax=Pseudahrensia aquimaris TaxID=744461 RepID=A0ABW3FDR6_9HYPH